MSLFFKIFGYLIEKALCAQECRNGYCSAPDNCTCIIWPSEFIDNRGRPVYQKPNGDAQDTGWTGFDCSTRDCSIASNFL